MGFRCLVLGFRSLGGLGQWVLVAGSRSLFWSIKFCHGFFYRSERLSKGSIRFKTGFAKVLGSIRSSY